MGSCTSGLLLPLRPNPGCPSAVKLCYTAVYMQMLQANLTLPIEEGLVSSDCTLGKSEWEEMMENWLLKQVRYHSKTEH